MAARARKVSRAVILREAIAEYANVAGRESTPLARMSPLIGVIEDGPGDLSERTGNAFARLLAARRKGGAARPARASGKRPKRPSR